MQIGQLSKLSGCSIQTVRYYEKEHLIDPPQRSEGNFRIYNNSTLSRLKFIRRCRTLNITLAEIHQILDLQQIPSESCSQVSKMIDQHIDEVKSQIKELKELQTDLQGLREKCHDGTVIDKCGILENLAEQDNA